MQKILVTYYSKSGSTKEIAKVISNTINDCHVDLLEVTKVEHLNYDGIIIGTPNMYGKPYPGIIKFLKQNEDKLQTKSIHLFFTCMDCYLDNEMKNYWVEIYADSNFPKEIKNLKTMNLWERSHAVSTYLTNFKEIVSSLNISSIAFFKGRLIFKRLSFLNSMVMRIICLMNKNIKQGDYYKQNDVETWTKEKDFFLRKYL